MYKKDTRIADMFNSLAAITIIISCPGLFGLVTFYTAKTKIKEIGISKAHGASVSNIILLG